MSHPPNEQIAAMRLQRRRRDALLFVLVASAGLMLLATAVLQSPPGHFPL